MTHINVDMPHPRTPGRGRLAKIHREAIQAPQRARWACCDVGRIGILLEVVGATLCQAVDLRAHDKVLDVPAGNGTTSLAAARRDAHVTSTDSVLELLDQRLDRAKGEGPSIHTRVADHDNLPFQDGAFDVALSAFGVMFAANQERTANELLRVVRPGGRIGLASWTPEGFVGELFRVVSHFAPDSQSIEPALAWGTEERIAELFGAHAADIRTERVVFRDMFPEHWIEVFRRCYVPVFWTFEALDADAKRELHAELRDLLERHSRGRRETQGQAGDYLEVVIRCA